MVSKLSPATRSRGISPRSLRVPSRSASRAALLTHTSRKPRRGSAVGARRLTAAGPCRQRHPQVTFRQCRALLLDHSERQISARAGSDCNRWTDTVNEVSVSFSPEIEEWDDTGDLPRRLITQARLYEVSLVLWGAYGRGHLSRAALRQPRCSKAAD